MEVNKFTNSFIRLFHPKTFKSKFLHFALNGDAVQCPCCGSRYITFLPAGLQKRANAKCIKCGSLERHRTLWLYLHENTNIFTAPVKILHVAPEKQLYQKFSTLNNIDYHPIDLNPDKYAYGSKTKMMDVTAMTYPDEFFDVVLCNHVLEHIPDDRRAMSEMFRVLKEGGWAILNVPVKTNMENTFEDSSVIDPKKREEVFGQCDHVRIYGKDYTTRLIGVGFMVKVTDYVSKFKHNERFRYGLKENELIYYCTK
jgi:SAM-dependent methyltransferase